MTARLDVLALPPEDDARPFILVLSEWSGNAMELDNLSTIAKGAGARGLLVFNVPVTVGSPTDHDASA